MQTDDMERNGSCADIGDNTRARDEMIFLTHTDFIPVVHNSCGHVPEAITSGCGPQHLAHAVDYLCAMELVCMGPLQSTPHQGRVART
jgi:hypothetical protein